MYVWSDIIIIIKKKSSVIEVGISNKKDRNVLVLQRKGVGGWPPSIREILAKCRNILILCEKVGRMVIFVLHAVGNFVHFSLESKNS